VTEVVRLNERQKKLVTDRVGLARAHGHRAWARLVGYERDEIISYAMLGLVAAAMRWEDYCREHDYEAYEGEAGSWFDTYASRRINGSIIDALRSADPATRRERALIKQILAAGVDLSSPWEYESAESIAAKVGISPEDVQRAVNALVRMPVSLEETTEDAWPADGCDVAEEALHNRVCGKVVRIINGLPEIYQLIVSMAYYLELDDVEIARRLPEISGDPLMGPYAVAWVSTYREVAASLITDVLRRELEPDWRESRPAEAMAG
jgi:DNA-directed RNA polymerase specialized sigma subunit